MAVPVLAGRAAHRSRHAAQELVAANDRLTAEGVVAQRAAVARERRHIAAELHDIVGHNVSLIGLQAGAGRRLLEDAPDRSRDALLAIEDLSRQTIGELRRLLEITEAGADPGLAPQPSLADLGALVDGVRERAGLEIDLEIDASSASVPAGVQLAAYRLVQEALTNAVRHSRAHRVQVTARRDHCDLCVTVVDDGRCRGDDAPATDGRGLSGMRERARLYGGSVTAGPEPDGGWAVRGSLPLPAEP